jgi:DDE superfamily endonuclease
MAFESTAVMTPELSPARFRSPAPDPVSPLIATWLAPFRGCFTAPVWQRALVLVAGALLAPGQRTVSAALRVMGLADVAGFGRYYEVLSEARWDARALAHRLLIHLLATPLPTGEVVIGIDDIPKRRGIWPAGLPMLYQRP